MNNFTVLIQGKLEQESYNFYVENYKDFPVIISTWIGTKINFNKAPKNFTILLNSLPENGGPQNMNFQFVSTLKGLSQVETEYVIKIRGDEYYSNYEYLYMKMVETPDKVITSPMFFRAWNYIQYHISDHLIAGKTENLRNMFKWTKYNFDNKVLWYLNDENVVTYYWEPEIMLTRSYLMNKYPDRYETVDGRILMIESFDIVDLHELKPFLIKANIFKTLWKDKFIPERNYSISTIDKLFSDDPYKREDGL